MQGGGAATRPTASLLSVCRCSRCFGAPAALAQRRQRTETRPTSFILRAGMEVMQESTLAQNKSLGVTDGVAEREGNQLSLKVFHLFFISKRQLQAHFWWQHPPGLLLWLCKTLCVWILLHLDETANMCTDCVFIVGLEQSNMSHTLWYVYFAGAWWQNSCKLILSRCIEM